MARTYQWSEIRTRIRQKVNKEQSQFVTNSEIDSLIEESYSVMYNKLVNTNENYFISSTTLALVAGTSTYALPTDFLKLKGVDLNRNGLLYQLNQVPWEQRNKYQVISVTYQSIPTEYMFYNNSLRFVPVPNGGYTVTVYYIPAPIKYVSDSTTIDGVSGFEKYIVNYCAACIRDKEEKDGSAFMLKAEKALQDMVNAVSPRDFENAITIQDVNYYDV
jgi:hypothetical protein